MAIGDTVNLAEQPDSSYWQNFVSGTTTNSELIEFLESSVDSNRTIDDASFFYLRSCVSPKNCLGLTVLAKQFCHVPLEELCNKYAKAHFDTIVTEESLKSLTVDAFKKAIECLGLATEKKIEMIAVYWAGFWKSPDLVIDGDVIRQKRGEFSSILNKLRTLVGSNVSMTSSLMSPANCITTAVLIKRLESEDLVQHMKEYITENVDAVARHKTFVLLSKSVLVRSLKMCHISKITKAKLIIRWAGAYPDERMKNATDMLFTKVLGDLDSSLLLKVTEYFRQVLEEVLSVNNYFKIAVITDECELEDLKIVVDRFVIRNFCTIKSQAADTALKENNFMMILNFLKKTRIPKYMRNTLSLKIFSVRSSSDLAAMNRSDIKWFIRASKGVIDAMSHEKTTKQSKYYLSEEDIHEWELSLWKKKDPCMTLASPESVTVEPQGSNQELMDKGSEQNKGKLIDNKSKNSPILEIDDVIDDEHDDEKSNQEIMEIFFKRRKKKAFKTEIIGPEGGVLELFGCCLKFPTKALKKEKEITISVDNNPENYPKGSYVIAPVFGIEPSMSFAKPIIVRICTWFRGVDGETTMATLFSRKKGSDWKKVKEVPLRSTNEIEFLVWHFSDTGVGVSESDSSNGIHTLKNSVYIQRDTGVIQSNFYRSEKDEHDVNTVMWEKSCATFTSQCITVKGKHDDVVKVKVKLTCPEEKDVPGKSWRHSDCFTIIEAFESGMHTIQAKLYRPPKNYEDLVEGDYEVFVGQETVASAFLVRKWPVMLDPLVQRTAVNQTISGVNVSGSGPITNTMSNSKVNPKANA